MFPLALIGAVFLIFVFTSCEDSTHHDYRPQDAWYGGQAAYQKTGQPSMLWGWRPEYDGD
jgi:hypothetical protein